MRYFRRVPATEMTTMPTAASAYECQVTAVRAFVITMTAQKAASACIQRFTILAFVTISPSSCLPRGAESVLLHGTGYVGKDGVGVGTNQANGANYHN